MTMMSMITTITITITRGDDEVEFDHPDYRYATAPMPNGGGLKPDSLQRRLVEASRAANKPPPPGSTGSSGDGYESFENTSNKKKRKIPLSSASSMHQSQLSAELANMGISNSRVEADEEAMHATQQQHYDPHASPSAGSGTGISGAGRGRYGRQDGRNRRPLGSSTMNTINGYHSRASPRGSDARNGEDPGVENTGGIISQAIKTAAEQGPLTPAAKGRENVSLHPSAPHHAISSSTPQSQFTFTCESDSATKMLDQQGQYLAGTPTPARSMPQNTHGTQTSPPLRGQHPPVNAQRPPPPPANNAPPAAHPQQQQAPPPKPRPRRNPAKEYAMQAAQRKKNQQYQNYHHRPKPDDMWICEFCEYEDIYGVPPYALIRAYEIKDRKERKKAEEKRRLLEKAKMKGRKNKKGAGKGGKNNVNNASAPAPPSHPQNYDPNLPPAEDEEYYDDEDYAEDDYEPIGPDDQYPQEYPPPAPASTPASIAAGGGARPQHHV
ncbi:hypothetical protein CBER1_05363 [Cercospora berteroae]|uniref:Uncharacterized protein n=1 Tax=Cercospora berteroae TaxID=357750 RepID=A0A2S6C744_9PEZI|nr:hypothetical protein CBER1_05363 [Cercospora berteroae]